jgi:hypothetical protein
MRKYNLHLIGEGSGNWCTIEIEAHTDEEAGAFSRQLYPTLLMELWRGPCLVRTFPRSTTARDAEIHFRAACTALRSAPETDFYRPIQYRQGWIEDQRNGDGGEKAPTDGVASRVRAIA